MADRGSNNVITVIAAVLVMTASLAFCTFGVHAEVAGPVHKPSATCSDYDLEEARITEVLAQEPDRLWWKVTDEYLAVFTWNMKWAFDIDVDADTVYIIEAKTAGPTHIKSVHMFTVRNHCITHYTATWGSVIAEMLRPDAWERGNPHVDGQTDREVPANRPPTPAKRPSGLNIPEEAPPGIDPRS